MEKINRRTFLKLVKRLLAATGLTALVGPIVAYFYPTDLSEMPSEPVLACKTGDLPMNSGITVRFGRYPALVIHTPDGLRGYSAVCTHFACICKWDPELGQIVCPCHDGFFDPYDGHVIAGPPPTALQMLDVQVVGDEIYVGEQA
jgi:nitrite reductase/ring-hydroxylating ferredoxin subunit